MECSINKIGYFFAALIWNVAILSVVSFFISWLLDIIGYRLENDIIRGYAYGIALISVVIMFWFGLLAFILSWLVKCRQCGSRILRFDLPFLVSLTKCRCRECS